MGANQRKIPAVGGDFLRFGKDRQSTPGRTVRDKRRTRTAVGGKRLMFRHRPHRRKSNDGFRTVSILPVPADGIAIFGSPAKKSNIALMPRQPHCRTVPNRTGRPSATISVPADGALKTYRPRRRRRQNHRYAVVYRPAILSARQRKRDCRQPTAAVIVPQTADMSAAL